MITRKTITAAVLITAALTSTALAQSPALTGQVFAPEDPSIRHIQCDPVAGEITYTLAGLASGPYEGGWSEQGAVRFNQNGTVTGFDATFWIDDGTDDRNRVVTGTRSFTPGTSSGQVTTCDGGAEGQSSAELAALTYTATLADGSTDRGTSTTTWSWTHTFREMRTEFGASGGGTQPPPPPPGGDKPSSKSDCANGGHTNYGYSNQGRCVSHVALGFKGGSTTTGGR